MQRGTRQKVQSLNLSLTYPDGEIAEFTGENLYADITLEVPELPPVEAQDAAAYGITSTEGRKLTIEVRLGLDGQMSMRTRPARSA